MKKNLLLFTFLALTISFVHAQSDYKDSIGSNSFMIWKDGVKYLATPATVKKDMIHCKRICFRITQTDSTNLAKTKIFSDFLPDTITYNLARSSTGTFTLTTPYNTLFTAGKTCVTLSESQGTGKYYFSATNTSSSVITLYSYLQTTDALTDAAFSSNGTFLMIEVMY